MDNTPLTPNLENLPKMVNVYKVHKELADQAKKESDKLNTQIKTVMREAGLTKFETDKYKVTCSTSQRQSFDDEWLLEKIKSLNVPGVVKTREYVDMVALEDAIYRGIIDPVELAPGQIITDVPTLRVNY